MDDDQLKLGKDKWRTLKWVCASLTLCAVTAVASVAINIFKTLVDLSGATGYSPEYESMVQGLDGNLYGTAYLGGANGKGTVFRITPTGKLTTLYNFCSQTNCADGSTPQTGLVLSTDGNFYGVTFNGGMNHYGTVFRITSQGMLTVLHHFSQADGVSPYGALVQGTDGNFYGTGYEGGAYGYGTVFKVTPQGTLTVLHNFDLTDGTFYGTTWQGGVHDRGTVFKITPEGTLTTLHSFAATEGYFPVASLVEGRDGNFYGVTTSGGLKCGTGTCGTIFRITPQGSLTTIHKLVASIEGNASEAPLIQGTDGKFYGTAGGGGTQDFGTVYSVTSAGALSVLYCFNSQTIGAYPFGGLVQATDGTFYGTTTGGGTTSLGTVFSLFVGLGPFVKTVPTVGNVGTSVTILGTNLTNATSVSFNGTAATFSVVSPTEITTMVPTGATSGPVEVTTSKGSLKSNVFFLVEP